MAYEEHPTTDPPRRLLRVHTHLKHTDDVPSQCDLAKCNP